MIWYKIIDAKTENFLTYTGFSNALTLTADMNKLSEDFKRAGYNNLYWLNVKVPDREYMENAIKQIKKEQMDLQDELEEIYKDMHKVDKPFKENDSVVKIDNENFIKVVDCCWFVRDYDEWFINFKDDETAYRASDFVLSPY